MGASCSMRALVAGPGAPSAALRRLLPGAEIEAWAERLRRLAPRLQGPVYFLWGTDWEDVPMRNARYGCMVAGRFSRTLPYSRCRCAAPCQLGSIVHGQRGPAN